jgi:hypothetical protein
MQAAVLCGLSRWQPSCLKIMRVVAASFPRSIVHRPVHMLLAKHSTNDMISKVLTHCEYNKCRNVHQVA